MNKKDIQALFDVGEKVALITGATGVLARRLRKGWLPLA